MKRSRKRRPSLMLRTSIKPQRGRRWCVHILHEFRSLTRQQEIIDHTLDNPTPRRARRGTSRASSTAASSHGDKVKVDQFTPTTARLAALSKSKTRESVSTLNAFPTDKDQFVWGAIQDAAKSNEVYAEALKRVSQDLDMKEALITYVRSLVSHWFYLHNCFADRLCHWRSSWRTED